MRFALLMTVVIVFLGLVGRTLFWGTMRITNNEFGKGAEILPGPRSSADDRFTTISSMISGGNRTAEPSSREQRSKLTPQEEYAQNQKAVESSQVQSNPFLQQ